MSLGTIGKTPVSVPCAQISLTILTVEGQFNFFGNTETYKGDWYDSNAKTIHNCRLLLLRDKSLFQSDAFCRQRNI